MAVQERVAPNQSLYIQNLPERLQKEDLRRELYMLLSTYGPVLDITALKTAKMRGQAHVLFRDVQSATQAMRACQGFDFFGREIKVSYAKSKSNTLAKLAGTVNLQESSMAPLEQRPQSNLALPAGVAPPTTLPGPPRDLPAPPKINGNTLHAPVSASEDAPSPQGVKRQRQDSDDEEAPMEEDDGEEEMEMSEDED